MPQWRIIAVIVFTCLVSAPFGAMTKISEDDVQNNSHEEDIPEGVRHNLANMKGWFTENQGQIENQEVKYVYAASDVSIGFIESGYLIKLTNEENLTSVVKVIFEGANRVVPEGRGDLSHKSNYFIGNNSEKWRRGVRNYEEVMYEDLYDGIDLVFYTNEKGLKYDFIVEPGGDPKEVHWSYDGTDTLSIDARGNLHLSVRSGELVEEAPISYQFIDKKKVEVHSRYWTDGKTMSFETGNYDLASTLVIDPLIYSTFIGGEYGDIGESIAVDSENCAYMTGFTGTPDFPTTSGCYDETYNGNMDVIVCKL